MHLCIKTPSVDLVKLDMKRLGITASGKIKRTP
jgi:hypothetical protein